MIKPFANFRKLSKNITDFSCRLNSAEIADRLNAFPQLLALFTNFPNSHLYLHAEGGLFYGDLILIQNQKTNFINANGLSLEKVLKKLNFKSKSMAA